MGCAKCGYNVCLCFRTLPTYGTDYTDELDWQKEPSAQPLDLAVTLVKSVSPSFEIIVEAPPAAPPVHVQNPLASYRDSAMVPVTNNTEPPARTASTVSGLPSLLYAGVWALVFLTIYAGRCT